MMNRNQLSTSLRHALLAFAFMTLNASAQLTLNIASVDATQFPSVKMLFNAYDAGGNRLDTFSPSDFTIVENGIPRTVLSVNCPPPPAQSVSLTLTFDVSFSMSAGNRMNNAKSAATTLINQFSFPPAESGITAFHEVASVIQPYTTDKQTVLNSISALTPFGNATDLFKGFMDPAAGAIPFTSSRPGKRAVVFLTDAYEILTTTEVNQIIAAANAANITIYTVSVITNPPPPQPLRTIATSTGGKWYEGVVTEQQAKDVYKQIAIDILNPPPCELEYVSAGCETNRTAVVTLNKGGNTVTQSVTVTIPATSIARVASDKIYLEYGVVKPPQLQDLPVVLTARNKRITIQSITPDKSQFYVTSFGGSPPPFTLDPNQSRTITVRFAPFDTNRIASSLIIVSDAPCNAEVILAGGKLAPPSLQVVQPNGGELLSINSSYQIQWKGVPPTEVVSLEYTTDAGSTWTTLSLFGSGLSMSWLVPNTPSDRCLMRVTSNASQNASLDKGFLPWGSASVLTTAFSNDGTLLASGSSDRFVRLWRPQTGSLLQTFPAHAGAVRAISFNQDSGVFATASADRTVRIWRIADLVNTQTIATHTSSVHTACYSKDGKHLLTSDDRDLKLWSLPGYTLDWNLTGFTDVNGQATINDQGTRIATVRGNNAYILDARDGGPLVTLAGHGAKVRCVSFSPDGLLLATGSDDRTVRVWNVKDGSTFRVFNGHTAEIYSVMFSFDGAHVISASNDRSIRIWRLLSNDLTATLLGHTAAVNSAVFSPDRKLIASGGADNTVRIWGFNQSMSDMSDSLWTIMSANPTISALPPTFRALLCSGDMFSDTTIEISNAGNKTLVITNATITGAHPNDFFLLNPRIPPDFSIPPGQREKFTIRFQPTAVGQRSASLTLTSNALDAPTYDIPLQATKDSIGIAFAPKTIMFGERYHCSPAFDTTITLRNLGTVPITIDASSFIPSEGFSILSPALPLIIDPQRDTTLIIRFAPTTDKNYASDLFLEGMKCFIKPRIDLLGSRVSSLPVVSRTVIDFGGVSVGLDSIATLVIRNTTRSDMKVDSLRFLPIAPDMQVLNAPPLPRIIAAGDSLVLQLRFSPTKDQTIVTSFGIITSLPCDERVEVTVRGTSSIRPVIAATTPAFRHLICAQDSISDDRLIFSNNGGQPLTITKITLVDANAAYALIPPPVMPPSLVIQPGPGKSDTILVRYKPKTAGAHAAQVIFESNAVNDPRYVVNLSGKRENVDFALSPPQITFGEVLDCDTASVKTIRIKNLSTQPIQIDSARFDTIDGYTMLDSLPITIDTSAEATLRVSFRYPRAGTFTTAIRFYSNQCRLEHFTMLSAVAVNSTPLAAPNALDFGRIAAGLTADRSFTITNPTNRPMTVASILPQFVSAIRVTVPPTIPFIIAPKGSQQITIRFEPTISDTLRGNLLVTASDPCPQTIALGLSGSAARPMATVTLPTLRAPIGSIVAVPITLAQSQFMTETGATSLSGSIAFNRTMLWPQRIINGANSSGSLSPVVASRDSASLPFVIQFPSGITAGELARIEFLVMLGNDETTQIAYRNMTWNTQATILAAYQDGLFTAEGICRAGGNRLVNAPSAIALWQSAPNPVSLSGEHASITYFLPIDAFVRLTLHNTLGEEVAVLEENQRAKGSHTVEFTPATIVRIGAGVYFYRLNAGGSTLTKKMLVIE